MDIEILNEDRLRYWARRANIAAEAVNELAAIARQDSRCRIRRPAAAHPGGRCADVGWAVVPA